MKTMDKNEGPGKRGFLVITGPTASGKTAFSTLLSQQLTIEVINGDVGQFYAPLSIGTAKPDLANVTVPHHLFDLITEPESLTAAAYRQKAAACVQEVIARGALPVFVGGSLFYIKSLFFPPQESEEIPSEEIPEEFDEGIETALLWEKLYQIDSARALAIDKNDRYRIARAMTLWRRTGRLPSTCAPIYFPLVDPAATCIVSVSWDRAALYSRVNDRVDQMFDQGLVREVAALGPDWWKFLSKKKLIGYHEVIKNDLREDALSEIVSIVQQNTRHYAKRQVTFLRAFLSTMRAIPDTLVIDANLTLCDDYLYIEQIVAWAKEHAPQCVKICKKGVNKD